MLDDIARRAGVGIATLYRRFPNKEALVRAAIEQTIAEQIAPAIERALGDDDPRHGLETLLEAALSMVARERNTLAAANNSGVLTAEISAPFLDSLTVLTRRGQQAGRIRADLVPEDTQRILGMLVSVLWNTAHQGDDWRRYLVLLLDALSPEGATPLPPAAPTAEGPDGATGHPLHRLGHGGSGATGCAP
ncbi:hypothetical protein GCM10022245_20710 [Streptomyces mayteni]